MVIVMVVTVMAVVVVVNLRKISQVKSRQFIISHEKEL
jgi:hypothetical protein